MQEGALDKWLAAPAAAAGGARALSPEPPARIDAVGEQNSPLAPVFESVVFPSATGASIMSCVCEGELLSGEKVRLWMGRGATLLHSPKAPVVSECSAGVYSGFLGGEPAPAPAPMLGNRTGGAALESSKRA